jgi:hypothetical protein
MRTFLFCLLAFVLEMGISDSRADFPSAVPFTLTSCATSGGATWASSTTGINVTFPTATTSRVAWTSTNSTGWDWSSSSQIAVLIANQSSVDASVTYFVVDRTGKQLKAGLLSNSQATSIPAGTTRTVLIDLTLGTTNDCLSVYGMACPPPVLTDSTAWMADCANVSTVLNYAQIATFYLQINNQTGSAVTLNIQSVTLYQPSPISALYSGIVDSFGQFSRGSWTNKITTTSDFVTRKSTEDSDLSLHSSLPGRDTYGASSALSSTASGYFRTQYVNDKWWLVAPNGNLFLSMGINHLFPSSVGSLSYQHSSDGSCGNATITQNRESMFQSISPDVHAYTITAAYGPFASGTYATYDFYGANVDRKYGSSYGSGDCATPWVTQSLRRLKSWGFNTLGCWSHVGLFQPTQQIPYIVYFHTAADTLINGIPDPYDSSFVTRTDAQAATYMLSAYVNDPWCLGYICDNERSWGNYPASSDYLTNTALRYVVAIKTLAADSTHPAKVAFEQMMESKYTDIASLNSAWGSRFASWTTFLNSYTVPSSPNDALITDMASFTVAFAARYANQVNSIIKSRDPNHLYLGARINRCSPEVLQGMAQGQDVISFNIYAPSIDSSTFAFTTTLGKPCMITEFSFGALDGNGMFGYAYRSQRAASQSDRAARYSAYVQSALALPAMVGVHWFEYADQPLVGRTLDGENYNFGFVDIADTPYQAMVDAARSLNALVYSLHQGCLVTPATMEAENTTVADYYTVAGGGWADVEDSVLSGGMGTQLNATANNDYITFETPGILPAGTYTVSIGIRKGPDLGKFRLYVGNSGSTFTSSAVVVGSAPTDEYNATASTAITEVSLGSWTTSSASTKWFKFMIVNKNSHSSANTLIIDYIKLN